MAEKPTSSIDGSHAALADWPTLIERAVDDVSRILRSDAQMFQTSMVAALELQVSSAVALLTIVAVMTIGALCILCSAIFLLHQWLPWWQAFGIAGLVTLIAGMLSKSATRRPAETK